MYSSYDDLPKFSDAVTIYVIVNLILSGVAGYAASQKGRSGVGFFFLSLFLSFPAAMITALVLPPVTAPSHSIGKTGQIARTPEGSLARCPYCAEWVRIEAAKCRHCGSDIDSAMAGIVAAHDAAVKKTRKEASNRADSKAIASANRASRREAYFRTTSFKVVAASVIVILAAGITAGVVMYLNRPPAPPAPTNTATFGTNGLPEPSVGQWSSSLVQCGIPASSATFTASDSIEIRAGGKATAASVNCFSSRNFGANVSDLTPGTSRSTPSGYFQNRDLSGQTFTFSLTPTN